MPRRGVDELFEGALADDSATAYRLSRALAEHFPDKRIVEGLSHTFDLDEFTREGKCEVSFVTPPHPLTDVEWSRAHGLQTATVNALRRVKWEGRDLLVATASWREGYANKTRNFVLADDLEEARTFASTVCAFCNEPRDSILTFSGSCWNKSAELFAAVQASSFDDLVLAGRLKEEIRDDFSAFVGAKAEYARYGVPWKRGVLFLGPPGNGKTHCLRATLRFLGVPILYVLSVRSRYETDDANIDRVFARAREVTPCVLVFEDLDAMITGENRSYFLNQLDGFAPNAGLLTIATSNHPERLDPAILDRPSRFDRKYHFDLPGPRERARYVEAWNHRLAEGMKLNGGECQTIADETDGFSFAYLKELFVSSMIRWMREKELGTMPDLLAEQRVTLRAQMASAAESAKPSGAAAVEELAAEVRKRLW